MGRQYLHKHTCPWSHALDEGSQNVPNCTCVWGEDYEPIVANDPSHASASASYDNFNLESFSNLDQDVPVQKMVTDTTQTSLFPNAWIYDQSRSRQDLNIRPETNYLELHVHNQFKYASSLEVPWVTEELSVHTSAPAGETAAFLVATTNTTYTSSPFDHFLPTPHDHDTFNQDTEAPAPTLRFSPSATSLDDLAIGSCLLSGKLKCDHMRCASRTFSRPAELRRHYNTTHASQKPVFWCSELQCERSVAAGGKPFRRRDKLKDHARKRHRGVRLRIDRGS